MNDGVVGLRPHRSIGGCPHEIHEISAVVTNSAKAEQHCRALLDKALDAGGKDSITDVVAHYALPTEKVTHRGWMDSRLP